MSHCFDTQEGCYAAWDHGECCCDCAGCEPPKTLFTGEWVSANPPTTGFFGLDRSQMPRRFTEPLPPETWRERLANLLERAASWVRR